MQNGESHHHALGSTKDEYPSDTPSKEVGTENCYADSPKARPMELHAVQLFGATRSLWHGLVGSAGETRS
jgi:hypothetical protein